MNVRAHVFIKGIVQGVFFRSETADKAREQNVTGWIRNLEDGQVEAIIEGKEANVNRTIEFCRHGSKRATVTNVEVTWEPYTGKYDNFEAKF